MSKSIFQICAEESDTEVDDWFEMDGPSSGVGSEHWLYNDEAGLEAYVCIDGDDVTVRVYNPEE